MFLLIALCLFSQTPADPPVTTPPPTTTQTSALSPAVKAALEQQRKELEYQQKELAFQRKELEIQRNDLETKIKQGVWDASKPCIEWNLFVKTISGVVGLSLLSAFFALLEYTRSFIKKKIGEEFQEKADSWQSVINNYDQDQKLKTDTRIHLLTATGNGKTPALLRRWGFKKVTLVFVDKFIENPYQDAFDVLLFDRLTEAPINKILAEMPDQVCVAYSPDGHLKDVKGERLNFANSQITLFSRILETARFHRDNKG